MLHVVLVGVMCSIGLLTYAYVSLLVFCVALCLLPVAAGFRVRWCRVITPAVRGFRDSLLCWSLVHLKGLQGLASASSVIWDALVEVEG